jgi:hypothetical protein
MNTIKDPRFQKQKKITVIAEIRKIAKVSFRVYIHRGEGGGEGRG